VVGFRTLAANARLERAKWAVQFHHDFFAKADHLKFRVALDSEHTDACEICKFAEKGKDTEEFTNFLNFFELLAYLQASGQLSPEDVKAIFHYYLCRFNKHQDLRKYIAAPEYGYNYLDSLLKSTDYC
jgi:hypothetical protein